MVWADYLSVRLGLAEIDERFKEAVVKKTEALALVSSHPEKGKMTLAKAERYLDDDAESAREELDEAYSYRKLLSLLFGKVERDSALVSRELTRRVGREPHAGRERKWTP